MKNITIFFFLLFSCTNMNVKKNNTIDDIDLDEKLSFVEFKNKIIIYAQQSNFPDIK